MASKIRVIFSGLIFTFCLFTSILLAEEPRIPLPADAVKISEEKDGFGPMKLTNKMYESSWDKNKLSSFYKKELKASGWEEEKEWTFIKDNNTLIIIVRSGKNKAGRTSFVISTAKVPAPEEILAMRKKNPDKLDFMPVYPGSEQVYLWDLSGGMTAVYETESSIKDVAFFYKSGMLNYGWRLANETPIKNAIIDCPECKKTGILGTQTIKPDGTGTSSQATLLFRKGVNEACRITIVNVSVEYGNLAGQGQAANEAGVLLPPPSPSKTTISVLYNVYKKTRP